MRVKMSKQPPPVPTTSVVGLCPIVIRIVGRPGTGSLPSFIAPPDQPHRPLRQYFSLHQYPRDCLVGCFGLSGPLKQYFSLYRLVGCFRFNGRLRHYFSLYRPSPKEREKEEKGYMRIKMSKQSPLTPTASAVGPCPTVIQIVGRPCTGSLLSTIAPPDHPSVYVGPFHREMEKEKRNEIGE